MAIEVEEGQYAFSPSRGSVRPGSRKGSDQKAELSKDGKAVNEPIAPVKRIFLQNPLHDYESVWWIVIWFVFYCEPEGVSKHVMELARHEVYRNRYATLLGGAIAQAYHFLPAVLRPLGEVLVEIRYILTEAYKSFEESFDGSEMLLVFEELRNHLLTLEERAKGLAVKSPIQSRTLGVEGMEQFDLVPFEEEQDWRMAEHEGGAGGQPPVADDPSTDVQLEDTVLGKRTRADPPPKVDRVLRPKTNQR